MKVKGTGFRCLFEECVKDNYYARFHNPIYHCCNELYFKTRCKFWQSQWSVKWRSRALGLGACLKSVSRTITVQGFILPDITAAEKSTLTLIVDDRQTNGRTESWNPISDPAISKCNKKSACASVKPIFNFCCIMLAKSKILSRYECFP